MNLSSFLKNVRLKLRKSQEKTKEPHLYVDSGEISFLIYQYNFTHKDKILKSPSPVILGGDWDKDKEIFESNVVYKSFCKHFTDGVSWKETLYYKQLQEGLRKERLSEKGGVDNFLKNYDKLYCLMKQNGFNDLPPIMVLIGRNGEFIRWDGAHRLAISKILRISRVPVYIKAVHENMTHMVKDYL